MEFLSRFKNRPTAWNINDKSDFLSVNSDGIKVNYTGEILLFSYEVFCMNNIPEDTLRIANSFQI